MIQQFFNFIANESLLQPTNKILLAVSGGIDSVVMVELFSQAQLNYSIAHCNFSLRGKESDEDETFVKDLANQKGVEFFTRKFDTKKYAIDHSLSIQMAARDLRNAWLEEILGQKDFVYYATAHHLDDQIETFFINLLRGTGISGLHGIKPKTGNLIHPMLFTYRKDIEEFAKQEKIAFRVDSSNIKTDYTRNKIRHELIPVIAGINENYKDIFTGNIQRLKQNEEVYRQYISIVSGQLVSRVEDNTKISIKDLIKYQPATTFLYEMIVPYGFNSSQSADIIESIGLTTGKQFYSKTHRLVIDRDYIIVQESAQAQDSIILIKEETDEINHPIKLQISRLKIKPDFFISKNLKIAMLDAEKLTFPLKIRKWKKGDYFYPLGMENKKLVSDFFIDNKFSIIDKENTWIMTSEDKIVWIIAHRIDNRFKITDSTNQIIEFKLQY